MENNMPIRRQTFRVCKELHGLGKVWVVRKNGEFITAFKTKNEANVWIYVREK
jgi:hypothetical protein